MAVFGGLNAGSVFVEYGMKPDKGSFQKFDRELDKAVRGAKETARKTQQTELGVRTDQRGFNRFGKSLNHAERQAKRTGGAINKHLKVGLASLGILGVASAVKTFAKAGIAAEASAKQFDAQMKASGITSEATKKRILDLIKQQSRMSGFMRGDLRKSFLTSLRTTGDWTKAIRLNNTAMNVARARGQGVEQTTQMLSRAYLTGGASLRRYGIEVQAVTTAQEGARRKWEAIKATGKGLTYQQKEQMRSEMELAKAQDKRASAAGALLTLDQKFAGQAEAYGNSAAGSIDKFNAAYASFKSAVGEQLLPAITPVMNAATRGVERLTDAIKSGKGPVAEFVQAISGMLRGTVDIGTTFGKGISKGMEYVITNAVPNLAKAFWNAFWNADILGKLGVAALLAWKLGPAFAAAGGKLMGRFGKGGAAAGGMGGAAGAGPIPVYVTNWGGAGGAPGAGGGKGGKGKGFGAVGTGAALLSGVSIAAAVVTINEILAAMGLPNSRTLGEWLAKAMFGDGDKINKAREEQWKVKEQLDWYNRHGGRAGAGDKLGAGLNRIFDESPNERRLGNIKRMLDIMAAMERKGKLVAGTTEKAYASLGTKANFLGINVAAMVGKSSKSMDAMSAAAARMNKNSAPHLAETKRGYDGVARAADRSAAAAKRAAAAARKAGKAAGSVIGAAIAGKSYSTGGYIGGPHSRAVPAMLHGDEYIINPRQADIIGRDRLDAALSATGAPRVRAGGSYRKGGRPAVIPYTQRFEDDMLRRRLALAEAEQTPDKQDDKDARASLRSRIQQRIGFISSLLAKPANSRKKWPEMWRLLTNERIDLLSSLSSYAEPEEFDTSTTEADKPERPQSPAEAAAAFVSARTDLYSEFGSNLSGVGPGGRFAGAGSSQVVQHNYFPTPPPNPHAWARSTAFDLRAAL